MAGHPWHLGFACDGLEHQSGVWLTLVQETCLCLKGRRGAGASLKAAVSSLIPGFCGNLADVEDSDMPGALY